LRLLAVVVQGLEQLLILVDARWVAQQLLLQLVKIQLRLHCAQLEIVEAIAIF
jgi:hypothetical protein